MYNCTLTVKFAISVEKQKETISGESSDRSLKKKLGENRLIIHFTPSYIVFI